MEDYKVITDYPIYGVSRDGKIKNLTTNKIMSGTSHSRNHIVVTLRNNGVVKLLYVHRLVALAYLENPNNYPFVDHIDQNPLNNNISNLRWASVSMNTRNTSKKRRGNIFNVKLKGGGITYRVTIGTRGIRHIKTFSILEDAERYLETYINENDTDL